MLIKILLGTFLGVMIFFWGMFTMTHVSGLSGNRLKKIIARLTTNPFLGIAVGLLVTALTQSSSGITVMVVSLVNSKIMNLYQASYVIIGANIGTTFTGQLVTFDFWRIIPHLLIIGVLLFYINFNSPSRYMGKFFIGFSLLFLGIKVMVYCLEPLEQMMGFKELMLSIEDQKLKGIFIGTITTAIIQSSSTGLALMQGLGFQSLITIFQAVPIILGLNIGTCVTTLISSIAADKNGKRAAIIHLLFNIIGVGLIFPFISLFSNFIYTLTPFDTVKQIANAHTLFNVLNTIILFPFIPLLVYISKKIIR